MTPNNSLEQRVIERHRSVTPSDAIKRDVAKRVSAIKSDSDAREMFQRFGGFLKSTPHERTGTMNTQRERELAQKAVDLLAKRKAKKDALMKNVRAVLSEKSDPVAEIYKLNATTERRADAYTSLMKQVAERDAAQIEMAKGKQPRVQLARPEGRGSDDDGDDLSKKILRYMKERGMDASRFDTAATAVLAQELKEHGLVGQGYAPNKNPRPGIQPVEQE